MSFKKKIPKNKVQETQLNSLSLLKLAEHKKKEFSCLLFPLKVKSATHFKYPPVKLQCKSCYQYHCFYF